MSLWKPWAWRRTSCNYDEGSGCSYITESRPWIYVVNDKLPSGVTYLSDDAGSDYDPVTGDWTVGTLSASASATLNIQATVDADTGGDTITKTADITATDQVDPDLTNNSDSVDISVKTLASARAGRNSKSTTSTFFFDAGPGLRFDPFIDTKVHGAELKRKGDKISVRIDIKRLPPGAYTNWWIVFNDPDACVDGCDGSDLAVADGAVIFATGGIVGGDGRGTFRAHLEEGDPGLRPRYSGPPPLFHG